MYQPPPILEATAHMRFGAVRSADLVEGCLERIREFDSSIGAWEKVDECGARAAARACDERRVARVDHGALYGIPIGIKDVIDVAGMPTRAGSSLRSDYVAAEDAPVVAALRAAGAVILGKTVTCEFACFDPARTKNPWNRAHTPGGSSSGSAAAVASRMCLGAVGTQTGGSVIRPAAYCGIVGYKPTFGAVSRAGVVPVSEHLDHVGFFGRRVSDVAVLATAVRGPLARGSQGSLTDFHDSAAAPRLGVLGGIFRERADGEMRRLLESALQSLQAVGARIEHLDAPHGIEDALRWHRLIMAYDAARYHQAAFDRQPTAYGPNISHLIREGLAVSTGEYQAALEHQEHYTAAVQPLFTGFDALVMPATPTTAPASLETTGDPTFNSVWSYVGTPAVTIPCGFDQNAMPAGLQLVGPRDGDGPLLATALWCEKHLDVHAALPW